jgi:hypothetical protein
MYIGNQTALNGVNTASQVSLVNHKLKIIPLSLPRGAFLGLIRLNIWGLATLLSKKAFLVDAATTAKQTPPNMWWDVGGRWRNGWWNLGGDWDKFVSAVNAGKGKKALGFKLAPKQIKEKLKAQGIGGSNSALGSYNHRYRFANCCDVGYISATAESAIYLAFKASYR